MKKAIFLALVLLFCETLAFTQDRVWKESKYTEGKEKYQVLKGSNTRDGESFYYNNQGTLIVKGNWKDGKKNGRWVYYFDTGKMMKLITYEMERIKEEVEYSYTKAGALNG
ncbi:MAG: hypothetical protein OEZ36_11115, partial [Spirochaetota bacterium]|nr:hypothetical protein [Spirochaetota bacterium]